MDLSNVASERAVLAGISSHGLDCLVDIDSLVDEDTFTVDHNKVLYQCLKSLAPKVKKIQFVDILSESKALGLYEYVNNQEVIKHVHGIMNTPIELEGVKDHAKKIRRLQYARSLQLCLKTSYTSLNNISGEESLAKIISYVEDPLQRLTLSYIRENDNTPKLIGESIDEYIESLSDVKESIGISSGYPSYDNAIGGGFRRKCVDLIGARVKSLRYGSFVYTKNGPVKIEDLSIGDKISHPFAEDSTVEEIFDFTNKDIYRVHFRDGDYVDCCEDHLWEVYKRYPYISINNKKGQILSTKEIANNLYVGDPSKGIEYKWDVKLPNPIEYVSHDVPIDPYVVGVLLGDGSLIKTCTYTSMDQDIIWYVNKYFIDLGYEIKIDQNDPLKKCISFRINGFQDKLREIGIFGCNCYGKFIPDIYKYNSEGVRLEILRGLLDTDGSCTIDPRSKTSRTTFTSVSKRLIEDVCEIVTSLGGMASTKNSTTTCNGKAFSSFRCEIRLPKDINPFKMHRKYSLVNDRKIGDLKRSIVKVEHVGVDNARCIRISNEDGLFLTNHHIITHNCGKSLMADNVALHVAGKLNIPVLMLDTEMSNHDHQNRLLSNISSIPINDIPTGKFNLNPEKKKAVIGAANFLKEVPYHYINISGKPFDEVLSIAKRWLMKEVGFENGVLNDCLIIYDYLKLMSSDSITKNIAEHQALGFQITQLHNFCVENDCACLSFVQLNRDGITSEDTDSVSGSDRLVWLCTSYSIFKAKSEEEKADDGVINGNRKLIPVVSRHGAGIGDDGYICLNMVGELARITEIGTIRKLKRQEKAFPKEQDSPKEGEPKDF